MSTIDLRSIDFSANSFFNPSMDKKKLLDAIKALELQTNILKSLVTDTISEAEEEAVRRNNQGLCTYCGEPHGSSRIIRGAHQSCHKKINRAINAFEYTDAQIVKRGWLLPKEQGGRKSHTAITEASTKRGRRPKQK